MISILKKKIFEIFKFDSMLSYDDKSCFHEILTLL